MNIKNWEELSKVDESKTHRIEVKGNCSAFLFRKSDERADYYLSTHTFYGGNSTKHANEVLKKCGFSVTLIGKDYD